MHKAPREAGRGIVVEPADRVGQDPKPMRLPPPSRGAISRMEETAQLAALAQS